MQFIAVVAVLIILGVSVLAFGISKMAERFGLNNSAVIGDEKLNVSKIIIPKPVALSGNCTDSDVNASFPDGKNIFKFGKACLGKDCKEDRCISNRNIMEYHCSNNKIASENIKCEQGYFCKNESGAYCAKTVKAVKFSASMYKFDYQDNIKKSVTFVANVSQDNKNPFPISVYISRYSSSSGKYKIYDDVAMNYNRTSKLYYLSIPVKGFETYQEPLTNVSVNVRVEVDGVVVIKSLPVNLIISY